MTINSLVCAKEKIFTVDKEDIVEISFKKAKKFSRGLFVPANMCRSYAFKLPSNLTKEQIEIQGEIKMYEEGGLDSEIDYLVAFNILHPSQGDFLMVEGIAVKTGELNERFEKCSKKVGGFDIVTPEFFSYSGFYADENFEKKSDLFIYLGEEYSFVSFYHDGQCIVNRTFDGLDAIAKKFDIDKKSLISLLATKGLEISAYEEEQIDLVQNLQSFFNATIGTIIQVISSRRALFGFATIQRIFLDFNGDTIPGLDKIFENYDIENYEGFVSVLPGLKKLKESHIFAQCLSVENLKNIQIPNFYIFEKKLKFLKRKSSKIIMSILFSLVFSSVAFFYFWYENSILLQKEKLLKVQYTKNVKQNEKYMAILEKRKKEILALVKEKEIAKDEMEDYRTTLNSANMIPLLQEGRDKIVYDVVKTLSKYKLTTKQIDINGSKELNLYIIAKNSKRDDIARFMEDMQNTGYITVKTSKISLRKDSGIYESLIEIKR